MLTATLAGVEIALAATADLEPLWAIALQPVLGLLYVVVGLVASDRRPSNRTGSLLALGGVSLLLAGLTNTGIASLTAVGLVMSTVALAVIIHALLAFPSGRLDRGVSRRIVVAGYVVAGVLQSPLYLFTPEAAPLDVLSIADRPDLVDAGVWLQRVAGSAVVIATAIVLWRRLRDSSSTARRVLGPLYLYGLVAVVAIPVIPNFANPLLGWDPVQTFVAQAIVLAGLPLAFASALLLGGFARTGELAELATWIGVEERWTEWPSALAETLGDPSLRLLFWLPDHGAYADLDGRRVELPARGSGHEAMEIEADGQPVGAIVYDPQLNPDPDVVRAAGGVVAMALDRDRLTAELRVERQSLQESRARLVEASEHERRRIARDLHDGIQATLLVHALHAHQLAADPQVTAAVTERASQLQVGLERTAQELRRLVHGLMPALLIERGLYAAIEDLVDTIPVRTDVVVRGAERPLPGPVETAAYFVVAEALTNAVKHSQADALTVRIERTDDRLDIEVADNGIGGADIAGSGLRGLVDRLGVLDGRLVVDSAPGSGTRVRAELPCGS
ncbi:MAG: sensor histidine kinase [Ilumatobacteraceae bacterium]